MLDLAYTAEQVEKASPVSRFWDVRPAPWTPRPERRIGVEQAIAAYEQTGLYLVSGQFIYPMPDKRGWAACVTGALAVMRAGLKPTADDNLVGLLNERLGQFLSSCSATTRDYYSTIGNVLGLSRDYTQGLIAGFDTGLGIHGDGHPYRIGVQDGTDIRRALLAYFPPDRVLPDQRNTLYDEGGMGAYVAGLYLKSHYNAWPKTVGPSPLAYEPQWKPAGPPSDSADAVTYVMHTIYEMAGGKPPVAAQPVSATWVGEVKDHMAARLKAQYEQQLLAAFSGPLMTPDTAKALLGSAYPQPEAEPVLA